MRASRTHATQAIDAVRRRRRRGRALRRHASRPASSVTATSPRTIERALLIIDGQPRVRVELVAAASARLAAGDRPSSEAIADKVIERATCASLSR